VSGFINRAIAAHAGTGKTYRLAHRYLGLMAAGVPPERIAALTFSRKAAGEIFDKIVEHLCDAATDSRKRAESAEIIRAEGLPPPPDNPAVGVRMLRRLLDQSLRLRIGTLDSFILSVVRAFPLELGVPPDTRPMDGEGGEAIALRRAILTRLFDPTRLDTAEERRQSEIFLNYFRLAHVGKEPKSLERHLDTLVRDEHGGFLDHRPPGWAWGEADTIWPPGERWWESLAVGAPPEDLNDQCRRAFANNEGAALHCAQFIRAGLAHALDIPPPRFSDSLTLRLLESAREKQPPAVLFHKREYRLPEDLWNLVRRAAARLVAVEVERSLRRTRGMLGVLERYDRLYAEAARVAGRGTFEDLARLLGEAGLPLSGRPDAPDRLYVDYRLDGRLDHWLLDEFQDTSNAQWSALRNLVDEVVQDPNRSFFYVGDVKQSIYGWRGGNYRLFGEVMEQYRHLGPRRIEPETIARCYRSLPAVIETVNAVFDGLDAWRPAAGVELGPRREAVEAFRRSWSRHESARTDGGRGYAALLEYDPAEPPSEDAQTGEEGSTVAAVFDAVADILNKVEPARRHLEMAVLVRTNDQGRQGVDALRRRLADVPVLHEGTGGIVDHPAVTLLLALVRYAAHPGDTVALRHLQMSPLAVRGLDERGIPRAVLADAHERGYARALLGWGNRLAPHLDDFGRQRLREMLAAAERFDATGDRDPDAFADFIAQYQVKSGPAAGAVRVMTIHQAKGLGFDGVIVPFMPLAPSFHRPKISGLLFGDDWVLMPPDEKILELAGGSPLAARERARADANFEQLCVLYVSMTRAKQALYLLVPTGAKRSSAVREADLLRERLATAPPPPKESGKPRRLYATGDEQWYAQAKKTRTTPPPPAPPPLPIEYAVEIPRREPSKEHGEGQIRPAAWLFDAESGARRDFGSAIHRLFERIEWIEDADVESLIADWRNEFAGSVRFKDDVERQFRACVNSPEIRRRLSRPADAARAEVWREAPFHVVIEADGARQLISGRFDRLVVERDATDAPTRATVFDYKSNIVETDDEIRAAAAEYSVQMRDYAQAAARLLGLSPSAVTTALLFTRPGRIVESRG